MGLHKPLLSWMSLTHCCFLGKSLLSISPLMFVIKVYSDDVVQAITSTAAPTLLKSAWNRPKLPSYSDLSTRTLILTLLAPWGHDFYSPRLRCRRGYLNPNQFNVYWQGLFSTESNVRLLCPLRNSTQKPHYIDSDILETKCTWDIKFSSYY